MSLVAVPVIVSGIVTFFECAALIVAVIIAAPPSSAIVVLSGAILLTLGLSSLIKFKVTSVVVVVALTSVPKVSIIVSIGSTVESSFPFVEIVTVPVVEPAAILIGLAVMVYSSVIVAVPLIV